MPSSEDAQANVNDDVQIGRAGTAGSVQGPYELTPEHMAATNGVMRRELVPPPDAELDRLRLTGPGEPI